MTNPYAVRVREIIASHGGRWISGRYENAKSPLAVECEGGHPFRTNYDRLQQGKWCRICRSLHRPARYAHSIANMRALARKRGGACQSQEYRGLRVPLTWKCKSHGTFKAAPGNVIFGKTWCPTCGLKKRSRSRRRPLTDVKRFVASMRGTILSGLSGFTSGRRSRLKIRCARGHIWSPTVDSLRNAKSWCGRCRNPRRGEQIARAIFEQTFGYKFSCCRPDFLARRGRRGLELDGYCEELRLAFEYQGPRHAFPVQKVRDARKRSLCKKHGVRLLEIPYVERPTISRVAEVIREVLCGCFPATTVRLPPRVVFRNEMAELELIARTRSGRLISRQFWGEEEAMKWKCEVAEHPAWWAPPCNIRKGHWCAHCAGMGRKNMKWLAALGRPAGVEVRSKRYRGANAIYEWKCPKGHLLRATAGNMRKRIHKGSYLCPECAGLRPPTLKEVVEHVRRRGWKILSKRYENAMAAMRFRCSQGHLVQRNWNQMQQGRGCRERGCPDKKNFLSWRRTVDWQNAAE